jgi:hypothetical protein
MKIFSICAVLFLLSGCSSENAAQTRFRKARYSPVPPPEVAKAIEGATLNPRYSAANILRPWIVLGSEELEGSYQFHDGPATTELDIMPDGRFAKMSVTGGVSSVVYAGQWRSHDNRVTVHLSSFRHLEFEVVLVGEHLSLLGPLSESKPKAYVKKRPNQSTQHNAGSRPSSGDSSASETPSLLGPRGCSESLAKKKTVLTPCHRQQLLRQ